MKFYRIPAMLLGFALLLSSCEITVRPLPGSAVSSLSVESNFSDGNGDDFVCYNQDTTLSYTFTHSSGLVEWEHQLKGISGATSHEAVLALSEDSNTSATRVSYSFRIAANTTELAGLEPNGIDVNPNINGEISLEILGRFEGGETDTESTKIAITSDCDNDDSKDIYAQYNVDTPDALDGASVVDGSAQRYTLHVSDTRVMFCL